MKKKTVSAEYYKMRESLPEYTCPDLNILKKKLKGDPEALEIIERLRSAHNELRITAKATMLLCIQLDSMLNQEEQQKSP